jgi:cell division protein FtsB
MVFLDDNSLIVRLKYSRESARLESEINSFRAKYDAADSLLKKMEVDSTVIEHIARKNYFMKRPNEDVYIFKEDQQK